MLPHERGDVPLAHCFVVPDTAGPVTGGTLYNRELVAALNAQGSATETLDLATALKLFERAAEHAAMTAAKGPWYWVDSLYLDELPELRRALPAHRFGLVLHYLPSLVSRGSELTRDELSAGEVAALEQADAFLVASPFMRAVIGRLRPGASRVLVVEPGRLAERVATPCPSNDGLRAVMVANLTAGKGIEPFLSALADELTVSDRFQLAVVGSREMDPEYARACQDLVARAPRLSAVELGGALPPESAICKMAECNLFVSASVMESYGMALAEARALGIPILALRGGNVEQLVETSAGGELASDHRALARAFVSLARQPVERARRLKRAREKPWPARSWAQAASEFTVQARCLEPFARRAL